MPLPEYRVSIDFLIVQAGRQNFARSCIDFHIVFAAVRPAYFHIEMVRFAAAAVKFHFYRRASAHFIRGDLRGFFACDVVAAIAAISVAAKKAAVVFEVFMG